MMHLIKSLFLILGILFPIHSLLAATEKVVWGSASLNPVTSYVEGLKQKQPYTELLSLDANGALDNSNEIRIVLDDPTQYPDLSLSSGIVYLTSNKAHPVSCQGFDVPCPLNFPPKELEVILNTDIAFNRLVLKLDTVNNPNPA